MSSIVTGADENSQTVRANRRKNKERRAHMRADARIDKCFIGAISLQRCVHTSRVTFFLLINLVK